jgi:hypothetical protein
LTLTISRPGGADSHLDSDYKQTSGSSSSKASNQEEEQQKSMVPPVERPDADTYKDSGIKEYKI